MNNKSSSCVLLPAVHLRLAYVLRTGCCFGDINAAAAATVQDPAKLMCFFCPASPAEMTQHSPQTGIEGTAFKNRPEVTAAQGQQKWDREGRALDYSEKLI